MKPIWSENGEWRVLFPGCKVANHGQVRFPSTLPESWFVEDPIFQSTDYGMFGDDAQSYLELYPQESSFAESDCAL
jgi:hypothetical protein